MGNPGLQTFKRTKIISWNVNGIIPTMAGGTIGWLLGYEPDIICFQETRTGQRPEVLPGFYHYWLSGKQSGYAGMLTLTKERPLSVRHGLGVPKLDAEGRLLILEFEKFWSVNAYFPRSEGKLARHNFRMEWDDALFDLLAELDEVKPVVLCGDFNITRAAIDIYPENARMMAVEAGYMSEEREALETLLESGFTDVFRYLNPDLEGAYTWWSNRLKKREENRGWRLDYFVISDRLLPKVLNMWHYTKITGSDHCPIGAMFDFNGKVV